MGIKGGNIHRCTSFPPINYQTGTNKTRRQQAECIKCLSCLLLNQLCNYLKDVLIVACSTLNISQRFSSSPSEIDWINQSELWGNRRPANQRCVSKFVCFSARVCGWGRASARAHVHVCRDVCLSMFVCAWKYIGLTAGLVQKAYRAFCLFGKQQARSLSEQGSKTCVNSIVQLV